jgi:hypothetical protein
MLLSPYDPAWYRPDGPAVTQRAIDVADHVMHAIPIGLSGMETYPALVEALGDVKPLGPAAAEQTVRGWFAASAGVAR